MIDWRYLGDSEDDGGPVDLDSLFSPSPIPAAAPSGDMLAQILTFAQRLRDERLIFVCAPADAERIRAALARTTGGEIEVREELAVRDGQMLVFDPSGRIHRPAT